MNPSAPQAALAPRSILLQNNFRNGVFGRVRNRDVRGGGAALFVQFAGAAVKQNRRCAGFLCSHFNVLPTDTAAPSCLQSFQRGFFCREARGIMLRGDGATRFTIRAFGFGKDALGKARRTGDGFAHAANFDDVDSY